MRHLPDDGHVLDCSRAGADPAIDSAIAYHPAILDYVRQDADDVVGLDIAINELTGVFGDG